MIKHDYSRNAILQEEEIYDYDTRDIKETGINAGRMRLPKRYDIAKYYSRIKKDKLKNDIVYRAGEHGAWRKKKQEDLLDFSDDFEWQITYSFPATFRNPYETPSGIRYGGRNVTFRRLYLILCEHFNEGIYFVDEYFDKVYPYTIKSQVDEYLSEVKDFLMQEAEALIKSANEQNMEEGLRELKITKKGTLSKSASKINIHGYEALAKYRAFAETWEDKYGDQVANIIRNHIIQCVTTGQLPCQFVNAPSKSTIKKRLQAGLKPMPWFSATKQLINSLRLYVKIGGKGTWETESGLLV